MVSYLVMKNNIRRFLMKKNTYLFMVLIPIILVLTGSISVRIEDKQLRVGILGSIEYVDAMSRQLSELDGVQYEKASAASVNTDTIMGKYQVVLMEEEGNNGLEEIHKFREKGTDSQTVMLSAKKRMVSMLLTIYMTIATLYGMKYHVDKRDGAVERVHISGGKKSSYLTGCFYSSVLITGVQLAVILAVWKCFDSRFSFSLSDTGRIFVFILLISNLYGILVTLMSKSEMMAGILGSSGAVLCSILGGTFVAVDRMPQFLQYLSVLSPMSWLLNCL